MYHFFKLGKLNIGEKSLQYEYEKKELDWY